MSLLLSQIGGALIVVEGVASAVGVATVLGIGINDGAHGGIRQTVRKVYTVDPPNRFWPHDSIRTY